MNRRMQQPQHQARADFNFDTDRDRRWVTIYDYEAIKLMPVWTCGQSDPLYAISSSGGENYAWVFQDAIANLDADIARVKKLGKGKYQLGKGTFTKKEIDELHTIRDALVMALEDPDSYSSSEGVSEGRRDLVQKLSYEQALAYYIRNDKPPVGWRITIQGLKPSSETITASRRGGWWIHWSNGTENGPFSSKEEANHFADYWTNQAHLGREKWTFKIDRVPGHDERMTRETHHVADFNTIPEIIAHAQQEGATHVKTIDGETKIYFPRQDGQYEEACVWTEGGYWHTHAPGNRVVLGCLPPGAEPIETHGSQVEGQVVTSNRRSVGVLANRRHPRRRAPARRHS
jgi:hypothetical protein